jgi:hypothetical protein
MRDNLIIIDHFDLINIKKSKYNKEQLSKTFDMINKINKRMKRIEKIKEIFKDDE